MNGYFITGTDTDVGKTALGALLLAEFRRRGINIAPMKPAQTGCDGQSLSAPDLDYSLSLAGMEVDAETYRTMAPYTFEPACSPHLAAEQAGIEIEIAEMVIAARRLSERFEQLLVEGAGGTMVPLNRRELMLDLMHALGLPVIVAARPGLGTINHTLLTIRALRSDGLAIAGVVFVESNSAVSGLIEADNLKTIEQFGKVPVLGTIPFCAALREARPSYADLPGRVSAEVGRIVDRL